MANKETIEIVMSLDKEGFRRLAEKEPVKAADSLGAEIRAFENWMMGQGMEPLSSVEQQILREYLGYKIVT